MASGKVVHVFSGVGPPASKPAPPILGRGAGGVGEDASMDEFDELVGIFGGEECGVGAGVDNSPCNRGKG